MLLVLRADSQRRGLPLAANCPTLGVLVARLAPGCRPDRWAEGGVHGEEELTVLWLVWDAVCGEGWVSVCRDAAVAYMASVCCTAASSDEVLYSRRWEGEGAPPCHI